MDRCGYRGRLCSAALLCATLVGCIARPPAQAPSSGSDGPTAFGTFEFQIPAGWSRTKPDRDKTVAMLLLRGSAWHNADGMLKVEVGKPAFPTAKKMAESFATDGGEIVPVGVSLDGDSGIRVKIPSLDMSRPRQVVVVFKGDKAYLIMAAGKNAAEADKAIDKVIETWHWRL